MEDAIRRAEGRVRLTRARAAATGVRPGPRLATPQHRQRGLPQIPSPAQSPAGQFWQPRRGRGRPRRARQPTPQEPEGGEEEEWGGINEQEDGDQNDQPVDDQDAERRAEDEPRKSRFCSRSNPMEHGAWFMNHEGKRSTFGFSKPG